MIQNCLQISSIIFLLGIIIQVPANPYIIVQRWDDEIPLLDAVTGTPYKNCGGSESVLKSVAVTPCNAQDSDHCVITRGNNVTFNMKFLSKVNSSTLQAKIYGIYDFIPVPFPCPKVMNWLTNLKLIKTNLNYNFLILCYFNLNSPMHAKILE